MIMNNTKKRKGTIFNYFKCDNDIEDLGLPKPKVLKSGSESNKPISVDLSNVTAISDAVAPSRAPCRQFRSHRKREERFNEKRI